ncbi:MAG: VTT domain-containing protein [Myxococcota bacterium]
MKATHLWGRRALISGSVILLVVGLWFTTGVTGGMQQALEWAKGIIQEHSLVGKLVFVTLAGLSAMLAFFSSAILVPVATAAWGKGTTMVLLWTGWILGGITAYSIGHQLGRAAVERMVSPKKLAYYEARVSAETRWWMFLLFQLAVPSEIPGYLAGIIRYRFLGYLAALGLGELPYALAAIYLGESFVERNVVEFALVLCAGVGFTAVAWRVLHRRLGGPESR